jgi:tRNA-specific 2-thiouridylase
VSSYAAGETPNPCVSCNHYVKFEALMRDVVAKFGADRLATGHYARVSHEGGHRLLRARDATKDQSYALYMLGQRELARLEFPIGELADKTATRAIAARFGLATATKPDSMDICFIGDDYRSFVRERAPEAFVAGPVERLDGSVVGEHGGIGTLTVGQRSGTGIATGERMYVLRLEPDRRAAIVGTREEISATSYELRDVRFTQDAAPAVRFRTQAVLRYRGTPLAGSVTMQDDRALLELDTPALVAPGQAAVLYDGDEVVGGGIVSRVRPG